MASSYSVDQKVICVFLLFWVSLIYPIDQAKHADFPSIRRLQIFSERCSGSNYVAALLLQHFDFDNCVDLSHLGSSSFHDTYDLVIPIATNNFMFSRVKTTKIDDRKRHCIGLILYRLRSSICRQFSRWLNMKLFVAIGISNKKRLTRKALTYPYGYKHFPLENAFQKSDDCLFVVVFRNPYDWISSFSLSPWDGANHLHNRSFSEFIRLPWEIEPSSPIMHEVLRQDPWVDRNPLDRSLFKTVMDLRAAKIKTMLALRGKVANICYVNYELVLENPQQFLEKIHRCYKLPWKQPYVPIANYKSDQGRGPYRPKDYKPISK